MSPKLLWDEHNLVGCMSGMKGSARFCHFLTLPFLTGDKKTIAIMTIVPS